MTGTSSFAHSRRRQRVDAEALVASKAGPDGRSRLDRLEQRSGAKIRMPRTTGLPLEAVLVNTAGGLTGGDRIRWSASAGRASHLRLCTAACEKVYRSDGPSANQFTRLEVGKHGRLDWLPQETILYDGGRLHRRLEVDLAADARLLAVEAIVIGRKAMGESVQRATFRDDWTIRREGRLLHAERLALQGDLTALAGRTALGGACTAFATCLACDPGGAESIGYALARVRQTLDEVIAAIPGGHVRAAASALPGRLVIRFAALDGQLLRSVLLPALETLDDGRTLPRVWRV